MLTLVWRAGALDDLEAVIRYIAERNRLAAERLQDAIEACAERLPEHPFSYRPSWLPARGKPLIGNICRIGFIEPTGSGSQDGAHERSRYLYYVGTIVNA